MAPFREEKRSEGDRNRRETKSSEEEARADCSLTSAGRSCSAFSPSDAQSMDGTTWSFLNACTNRRRHFAGGGQGARAVEG